MNWIKLTPETELPVDSQVFVRVFDGLFTTYHAGFSTGNMIALENPDMEEFISHYALIEEPEDVIKEPVRERTAEDRKNLPFDTGS